MRFDIGVQQVTEYMAKVEDLIAKLALIRANAYFFVAHAQQPRQEMKNQQKFCLIKG